MRSSHALASASEHPTPKQMKEFWSQVQSGRITKDVLQRFLRSGSGGFKIWRTLTIGGVSKDALLERGGFFVSDWAKDIISKPEFTTLPEPQEIQLVKIKVRDLGFTKEPTTTELFAKAKKKGLDLCPAEVGPHLRLILVDQPKNDCLWVAMEPITASDGFPLVFCVYRDDGDRRCLCAFYTHPDFQWNLEDEIVFSLRK